jgi:hypothetical protein
MAQTPFQHDQELRRHLRKLLGSGDSHATNHEALDNFPEPLRGKKFPGIDHTAWQMLEHLRIAQADILDFCVNPFYKECVWPDDYWPASANPPDHGAWTDSCEQFFANLKTLEDLIGDPEQDLFARITWGKGQTLLREALVVADHNTYHIGQIILLRKALGAWS